LSLLGPPSARTRVCAVIGWPVRHSASPAIHNAAFAAAGLDWVFVACEVPAGQGEAAVRAAGTLGLAGLSVTMPHKEAAARALDAASEAARRLGAVNTVAFTSEGAYGDNTDGDGLVDFLRHDAGLDPAGRRFLVLGAGGAARAAVLALAQAGAASVTVWARVPERAAAAASLAGPAGRPGSLDEADSCDAVVNATPVGMAGVAGPDLLVDEDRLGPGQLVVDLVYYPPDTALLRAARRRGARAANGLGMLVRQAARAFELWTAEPAPLAAMAEAAARAAGAAG